MDSLVLMYLTVAIFALAIAILVYPTMVERAKRNNKRRKK